MKIASKVQDGQVHLLLTGRFTFEDHKAYKAEITGALGADGVKDIVLDMTGLTYLDSSALGALLLGREMADAKGIGMSIKGPQPGVLSILKVVKFDQMFHIGE